MEVNVAVDIKWRAPSKRGVCAYFGSIFQVARNPLKFGMLTLFVSKNVPVFFFSQAGKRGLKHALESPPPPPPLSNGVKHTHAQCFSSQRSKSYNVWRQTRGENALAVIGAWNRGYSLALVIFIIQVGPKWRAPWKGGVSTYLIAIFHAYSFCVKKCPCVFFFQESRKIWTKLHETLPPPPPPRPLPLCPSPNIVGFRSLRTKTLYVCVLRHWPLEGVGKRAEVGGGGGVDFQERVWSLVSPLVKKGTQGHFLTQK